MSRLARVVTAGAVASVGRRLALLTAALLVVGFVVVLSALWGEPPQADRLCDPGQSCTIEGA